MNRLSASLLFGIALLLVVSTSWKLSGQERIGAPNEITDREIKLEYELRRTREALAVMGENHPKLGFTQRRVTELEAELVALAHEDKPFIKALVVADREEAGRVLEQMSEKELRLAVLHLFGNVRDLTRRVQQLEAAAKR